VIFQEMTIKQAQVYVEEKTGMRSSMFYECIQPLLHPKPIAQNFRNESTGSFGGKESGGGYGNCENEKKNHA
jgi:hypothetical protein